MLFRKTSYHTLKRRIDRKRPEVADSCCFKRRRAGSSAFTKVRTMERSNNDGQRSKQLQLQGLAQRVRLKAFDTKLTAFPVSMGHVTMRSRDYPPCCKVFVPTHFVVYIRLQRPLLSTRLRTNVFCAVLIYETAGVAHVLNRVSPGQSRAQARHHWLGWLSTARYICSREGVRGWCF
jgi:hypothetical protein